ncbi:MAG: hypothetical protein BV456_11585, partial [Thermoplasmata archaeon M8B2D]
ENDIGKIKKNDFTDIIVRLDDFGGRPGVTIREFVTGERYTGFTKAGVKIHAADFEKFKEMINSISESDLKVEESPEDKEEKPLPKNQKTLDETSDEEMPDY